MNLQYCKGFYNLGLIKTLESLEYNLSLISRGLTGGRKRQRVDINNRWSSVLIRKCVFGLVQSGNQVYESEEEVSFSVSGMLQYVSKHVRRRVEDVRLE